MDPLIYVPVVAAASAVAHVIVGYAEAELDRASFDRRYDVETAGRVPLSALSLPGDRRLHAHDYMPTPLRAFRSILRALGPRLDGLTFVDFGSGKGRVLLAAAEFPLKQIVGVEICPELNAVAERNLRRFRGRTQRCFDLRTVCMDAAALPIPDGPCALYFFNPFDGALMREVAERVRTAYERDPRKLYVILYHPRHADVFAALPFLRRMRLSGVATEVFEVFESVAAA